MRLHALQFLEFAYALLAVPKMAGITLREMERRDTFSAIWASVASMSLATGLFYLRASYSWSFFVFIPILSGIVYVFNRFYSRLLSARLLSGPLPERAERRILPALLEGSCLPGVFFLPLSITAREFSHPGLMLVPGFLAITAWVVYIQYMGIVFSLEIDRRRAITLLLHNHVMLVIFPIVSFYFFGAVLVSLAGVRSTF